MDGHFIGLSFGLSGVGPFYGPLGACYDYCGARRNPFLRHEPVARRYMGFRRPISRFALNGTAPPLLSGVFVYWARLRFYWRVFILSVGKS